MGLVYGPDGRHPWAKHSALQPTPCLMDDDLLRIFVGFRDDSGVGRIGFVDVNPDNPGEVLRVSEKPVLDIGLPGTFDDNGVIPCAIVRRGSELFLYYAGYQLGSKVRFLAFGGLARSCDGETFVRSSNVPVLDRTSGEFLFRAIHSMFYEDGVWKTWYGAGNEYLQTEEKALPKYNVRYIESKDGITFAGEGRVCIDTQGADEYRIGRPWVIRHDGIYKMFYSIGTRSKIFRLGYAESRDGIHWVRMDDRMGLDVSSSGWDSQMICYPSVLENKGRVYLFYNGNSYGRSGFGYAILREW